MVGFRDAKSDLDALGVKVVAASVDPLDKAKEVADEVGFPSAIGVTRDIANALGAWWEERRQIVQPSEFLLDANGKVLASSYSAGRSAASRRATWSARCAGSNCRRSRRRRSLYAVIATRGLVPRGSNPGLRRAPRNDDFKGGPIIEIGHQPFSVMASALPDGAATVPTIAAETSPAACSAATHAAARSAGTPASSPPAVCGSNSRA